MKNLNFYCVTSPTGGVREYFTNRDSAIAFIIDEFAMALCFRTDNEGDRLSEYLKTHDETPNQYQYKYFINAVPINGEYDKKKVVYLVNVDEIVDGEQIGGKYVFEDYDSAREFYDNCVDDDIKKHGEEPNIKSEMTPNKYERWNENEIFCFYHFGVELTELEYDGYSYAKAK